jgi:hypothetical protein
VGAAVRTNGGPLAVIAPPAVSLPLAVEDLLNLTPQGRTPSTAVAHTIDQSRPKDACTATFRKAMMSGHGTSRLRSRTESDTRFAASPITIRFWRTALRTRSSSAH